MATLINNSGVQYYANKMVQAENRKVGSKSLPTALNDIDSSLDEMKNLFDTEYGSALDMKLENTENIFSVGTGSGVDKKADVENSFTDVELKGDTLVNIYGKGFSDIANISNSAGEIVDDGYYKLVANGSYRNAFLKKGKFPMKPSTVYTVVMFVRKETLVGSKQFILSDGTSDSPFKDSRIDLNGIGTYTKKVTTLSDFDSTNCGFRGYIPPQTTSGELEFKVMLLEGDWTNYPIPNYFEGMKSVGEVEGNKIEVLSNGKNLLSGDFYDITTPFYSHGSALREIDKNYWKVTNNTQSSDCYIIQHIDLRKWFDYKVGEKYTISFDLLEKQGGAHFYIIQYGDEGFTNGYSGNGVLATHSLNPYTVGSRVSFTFSPLEKRNGEICLRLNASSNSNGYVKIGNIQIERGSSATSYSSEYNSDKKQISLNEPLKGLPNGVKDSIEKINGEWKIVRRCGEIILDGSQSVNEPVDGFVVGAVNKMFELNSKLDEADNININAICELLPSYTANYTWKTDLECISLNVNGHLQFRLSPSRFPNYSAEGCKQWLTQNPMKVIYKLKTPTIEDISPVTLQVWKNGTISIDSVIPVESTHTVALNKPAQIKRNIEELTQLRNKVKSLEEQYDQIALEQAHQLELINHSFELDYI